MGTASFSVTTQGKNRGTGASPRISSAIRLNGVDTTSVSAIFLEDAVGDISLVAGDVFVLHADEAMRILFGGSAVTASTGHYVPAGVQVTIDVETAGKVSIIDVA